MQEAKAAPIEVAPKLMRENRSPSLRVLYSLRSGLKTPPENAAGQTEDQRERADKQRDATRRIRKLYTASMLTSMPAGTKLDQHPPATFASRVGSNEMHPVTYAYKSVGENGQLIVQEVQEVDGQSVLKEGTEKQIPLLKLISEAIKDVDELVHKDGFAEVLEDALPDEIQREFLKAFVEVQKTNPNSSSLTEVQDQKLLVEAAKKGNLITSQDMIVLALHSGYITETDADLLLHPEKLNEKSPPQASTPKTDGDSQGQTADSTKTQEVSPPVLSEKAKVLQTKFESNPVLSVVQLRESFDLMGIPHNKTTLDESIDTNRRLLADKKTALRTAQGNEERAIELQHEINDLERTIAVGEAVGQTLDHYKITDWDLVDNLYDAAEAGQLRDAAGESVHPAVYMANMARTLQSSRNPEEAVLTILGQERYKQMMADDVRKAQFDKIKGYVLTGGGVVGGLLALMIVMNLKGEQQR